MHRTWLLLALVAPSLAHALPSWPTSVEPMVVATDVAGVEADCDRRLAQIGEWRSALEQDDATPSLATLRQFDALWRWVDDLRADAGILLNTSPDAAIRNAGRACQARATDADDALWLSREIHGRLKAIPLDDADATTRHVMSRSLARFDRSGVSRDDATRERIAALNREITTLELRFAENIANGRKTVVADPAELDGLPADYIAARKPGADGKVVLSTDSPDVLPVLNYATRESLRRRVHEAYATRAYPANEPVLRELIARRDDLATLLGRADFASLLLEDRMLDTTAGVQAFLDGLLQAGDAQARRDDARMLARLQREQPGATNVPAWSDHYVTQLIRKEGFAVDPQEVRRYFAYDNVRDGILQWTRDLFGVEIRSWQTAVWDPSVEAYEMLEGGEVIGRFYLDTHPRSGKFNHAAVFGIRMGVEGASLPMAALVTNFPAGDHGTGLMEHRDVELFLHEYGHLIHVLFSGRKQLALASARNLEPDFTEAPSKMLENLMWDYDTLSRFAVDSEGRTIPRALVEKMNRARYFGEALRDRRQLALSNVSLTYYMGPPAADLTAHYMQAYGEYGLQPLPAGTHPQYAFPHLGAYSAAYYTYMWSQTIALDLFTRFEQEGIRNPAVARDYREKVLAPGGSMPAAQLVEGFLGRPMSLDAYRRRLASGM